MNTINREIIEHVEAIIKTFRSRKYAPMMFSAHTSDLTMSDMQILVMLSKTGPSTVGDIAAYGNVKAPTASAMVKKLERLGYVSRIHGTEDRRVVRVALTQKGKRVYEDHSSKAANYMEMLMKRYDRSERQKLLTLVREIRELFEKVSER
ncbi:MAG: MarR family transcriptional regulator [Spirochaetota bacterium]